MKAPERRVTYAEMLEWPDDGRQYELYDGEVIVVPAPFPGHQRVTSNLADLLRDYAKTTGGLALFAPLDIVLSEHDVVQPDVVFFSRERRHLVKDWEVTRAAPDLAVEVLSERTESRDRGRKMDLLARFGVPEYWIVDPRDHTIELFVLSSAAYGRRVAARHDDIVASPTLSGLSFAAARVFAG
jgi:Uma2 family endonuclease